MTDEMINRLLNEAKEIASRNFCCPYSKYTVGAALLTEDNEIYKGFNIENDGIQSICAERVAFAKALTNNKHKFIAIAVAGKYQDDSKFKETVPCGYCLQFMSEYGGKDLLVYTTDEEKIYTYKISDLLPHNFDFEEEKQ